MLLINSKGKMFNFLKFKLQNVLNSNSIWKRIISQTTSQEVKYKFEYCSFFLFFSFIFRELSEKVLLFFNRYNIRKQGSFLATRKLESQFLEQEIFSLPNMSEYHSPLGISFQWSHFLLQFAHSEKYLWCPVTENRERRSRTYSVASMRNIKYVTDHGIFQWKVCALKVT